MSYCSPDRMFCPPRLTYSYQSTPPPHTHARTLKKNPFQSRQYAKHREKQNNLNQPDLARQQIGAKDYGGSRTLGILGRLLLPVSCLLSLSRALSLSLGLNFDLAFVNR